MSEEQITGDPQARLLTSAAEYLENAGWRVLVISVDRVQSRLNPEDASNYEFVLRFTGARKP